MLHKAWPLLINLNKRQGVSIWRLSKKLIQKNIEILNTSRLSLSCNNDCAGIKNRAQSSKIGRSRIEPTTSLRYFKLEETLVVSVRLAYTSDTKPV